ncbi:MAG: methyltransferase domain-containing protein [Candidatus Kariarchaeaceae archaeon]
MTKMNFGGGSVAEEYDTGLVPILFRPWAEDLVERYSPWNTLDVLDLAAGTGIVSETLLRSGTPQSLVGVDISADMLARARIRVPEGDFREGSAESLPVDNQTVDRIVIQQGYQFFPDKLAAAAEFKRVLRDNGDLIASVWLPVGCEFFDLICESLEKLGLIDIAAVMRRPFADVVDEITAALREVGFNPVEVQQQSMEMMRQDISAADLPYSTPIGPLLRGQPAEVQQSFKTMIEEGSSQFGPDSLGMMITAMITATI